MDGVMNLIFPRICPFCGKILQKKKEKACEACQKKLPYVQGPRCMKCSKTIEIEEAEYCYDCSRKSYSYKSGLALYQYTGDVKKSIYNFKYNNKREFADFYAQDIKKHLGKEICRWKADMFVPVPLYQRRQQVRGFNQAQLLAKKLSFQYELPMEPHVLKRIRNTEPQKQVSGKKRNKNLENAFKIQENIVKLKKVVLVDDIYTTGSTIEQCSKVLLDAGAKEVYFIALAIGRGY